ncbi:MAG: nucleotidyltransferase domain-containing protein, partial [Candidatus Bipolaricaulota bacterium]|nr:nucleotidyltransferase domain-containing protein [Candidatus Bipolaricaulota bacterium]MDW8126729.1 nucleotidyltransferase domain-containing protein [Candidatus Bipolaricaulota bacterium]
MARLMSLLEKRRKYVEELEKSVERVREVLAGLPEVERVILFGSYARGQRDLLTDLDVLVVM